MGFRIKHLTVQEIYVLENRPGKTYKAIGQDLGVSPERVRQIRIKAERKLRAGIPRKKNRINRYYIVCSSGCNVIFLNSGTTVPLQIQKDMIPCSQQ